MGLNFGKGLFDKKEALIKKEPQTPQIFTGNSGATAIDTYDNTIDMGFYCQSWKDAPDREYIIETNRPGSFKHFTVNMRTNSFNGSTPVYFTENSGHPANLSVTFAAGETGKKTAAGEFFTDGEDLIMVEADTSASTAGTGTMRFTADFYIEEEN